MSRTEWNGILVYIEGGQEGIAPVSRELISKAGKLAKESGEKVYGIYLGDIQSMKACLKELPLEKIYLYETQEEFQAKFYGKMLAHVIRKLCPSTVLIGGTICGRALAPRAAVEFKTGVTADCTELGWNEEGNLVQTRPAFGGNIMASILTTKSRPQIATVRPGVFNVEEESMAVLPELEVLCQEEGEAEASFVASERTKKAEGIEKQDILVVAGRGVKKKEDLEMLRELADLLGGELASSRALVEKGWMPPSRQIGLSGNTVKPKCMLTFGVSGTVQFMAGMKNTPNIIAVNTDPEARIFEIAHYPICGDLYEIVPELIKQWK